MDLIKVAENALTVELSWGDCTFLSHLIREALGRDALPDGADFALADGYARTLAALLEAGGMATWAYTVEQQDFTIEEFRTVAPVTPEDRAKAEARLASARRRTGAGQGQRPEGG